MRYSSIEELERQLADGDVTVATPVVDEPKSAARRQLQAEQQENFRQAFETVWRQLNGPELEREYRFCQRRWRFDYCHIATQVAIELQGGIWGRGRHVRGKGYQGDCEKLNHAVLLGWKVFYLPTGMITPEHIEPIIEHIREREAE